MDLIFIDKRGIQYQQRQKSFTFSSLLQKKYFLIRKKRKEINKGGTHQIAQNCVKNKGKCIKFKDTLKDKKVRQSEKKKS